MEIELISKIKEAIRTKDKETLGKFLKDFDAAYASEHLTLPENYEEYLRIDQIRRSIVVEIHNALEDKYDLFKGLKIKYDDYNLGLMEYIAFNNTQYMLHKYETAIAKIFNEEYKNLDYKMDMVKLIYDLVEGYFYEGMKKVYDKKMVTYDFCNYIEEKLGKLYVILDAVLLKEDTNNTTIEKFESNVNISELFIGNPLNKRKGNKYEAYKNVSQTIKIIDDEFSYISGVQKFACEMYSVEPTSYSKWKNDRAENQELIDEWNREISPVEIQNIIKKITERLKK